MTFTDTVCNTSSAGATTGTVTFRDAGRTLGTGSLTPSPAPPGSACAQATFGTASLSAARHVITADYLRDANHAASVLNAVTQVVNPAQAPTASTLTSLPNPSTFREPVIFIDTVCGEAAAGNLPTGTVTFKDNGSPIGTYPLIPAPSIGCTMAVHVAAFLSVGSHPITADYSGDANHAASTSNTVIQVVRELPSISTLTSSPNPSAPPVIFTVEVCGGAAGNGATGEMKDGGSTPGAVTVGRGCI